MKHLVPFSQFLSIRISFLSITLLFLTAVAALTTSAQFESYGLDGRIVYSLPALEGRSMPEPTTVHSCSRYRRLPMVGCRLG